MVQIWNKYAKGWGYVTQVGGGILDLVMKVFTSRAVRAAGSEAFKAAAKSCGDKCGTKLVENDFWIAKDTKN